MKIYEIRLRQTAIVPAIWWLSVGFNADQKRAIVRKLRLACPDLASARLHLKSIGRDRWEVSLPGQAAAIMELVPIRQAV